MLVDENLVAFVFGVEPTARSLIALRASGENPVVARICATQMSRLAMATVRDKTSLLIFVVHTPPDYDMRPYRGPATYVGVGVGVCMCVCTAKTPRLPLTDACCTCLQFQEWSPGVEYPTDEPFDMEELQSEGDELAYSRSAVAAAQETKTWTGRNSYR